MFQNYVRELLLDGLGVYIAPQFRESFLRRIVMFPVAGKIFYAGSIGEYRRYGRGELGQEKPGMLRSSMNGHVVDEMCR
jgi:hypothetical protein